jgi:hypothetical protein
VAGWAAGSVGEAERRGSSAAGGGASGMEFVNVRAGQPRLQAGTQARSQPVVGISAASAEAAGDRRNTNREPGDTKTQMSARPATALIVIPENCTDAVPCGGQGGSLTVLTGARRAGPVRTEAVEGDPATRRDYFGGSVTCDGAA